MRKVKCRLCGSDDSRTILASRDPDRISDEVFQVDRCRKCRFVYVNPQPSEKELKKFYSKEYFAGSAGSVVWIAEFLRNAFLVHYHLPRFVDMKNKGAVLDVGCGTGTFLEKMAKGGWETHGVDPSENAVKLARKRPGVRVHKGTLDSVKLKKNYFDLITMWSVFEHVLNPRETLRATKKVLKKDGVLIITTQNIDSLQSRLGGNNWFALDLPRHIYHYSPKTLRRILEEEGFEVIKIKDSPDENNFLGWIQTILNMAGTEFNFLYKILKRYSFKTSGPRYAYSALMTLLATPFLILFSTIMIVFSSRFNTGGIMVAYAKK